MATKIKRIFQKGSLFNITNETTGQPVTEASLVSIGDILDILTMDADKVPHIYGGCAEVISTSGFNTKIKVKDETNFILGYKDKSKQLPYLKITNNANVDLYKVDGTKITDTTELYVNDVIKVKPKDLNYFAGADVEALDDNSYIMWVNPPEDDSSEECTFRANVQEITLIDKEVERLQRFIVSSDFETQADIHCTHLRYNKEIPVGTIYTMLCKGDRFQLTFKDGFYVDMSDADKGFELEDAENHIYKATRIGRVYIDIKFKGKNVTLKIPNTTKCKVIKIDSEEVIPNDTVMKTGDKFRVIMTDARYYLKIPDNTTMNESGPWKYDELDGQHYFVCQIKNVPIDTVTIPDMPEKLTLNLDMREPADRDKIKGVTSIYGPTTSTLPSNIFHAGEPFKVELKDEYKNDYIITAKNERGFTIPSDDSTNFKIDLRYDPQIVLKLESNTTKVKITNIRDGSDLVNGTVLRRGDKFTVELPAFKKYINITFSDSIEVYHTYSSTKVTYIVREDATSVVINVEEAHCVMIDNENPDIVAVKTVDPPIVTLTTYPNSDTIHDNQDFLIEWINPSYLNDYKLSVIAANHKSEMMYTALSSPIIIKANHKAKIHILDKEHTNVTNMSNEPIYDNDYSLAIGDKLKIQRPPYSYEYRVKSVVGAVQKLGYLYEITDENVTIEIEPVPFVTINNDNPDIISVSYYWNSVRNNIDTFPCSDKIHQTQEIVIEYRDEDLYKPLYDINVTGATATPSEHRYRVGTTDVNISAVMKVVSSHIKIKHAANVTVTAESDGREIHDGDTSISTTDVIKIVPKKFFKINPTLLKGLKATSDPNKFTIVAKEVEVDVEEEPTVILYNNKDSLLKILVQDNEVTTFPSHLLHNEEIFKVFFRVTSLKDKYDMKVTGAELQASIPDGYSYKVSGPVVTVDCEHKKIPATIHIPDETHVKVKTVENAVIHDGDTSLFVGSKIKIIPKPGYKIKEPLVGILKEGKEFKLIDADVTIEVEPRPYVTINNEAETLVKVSTSAEPPVEIVTFPSTADIREGETFQVEFRNATDENKYNIIVDGAMKLSDKRYQAVSSPITIKTKDRPKVDPYLIKLRRSQGFGVRYIKWSRKGKLVHENSFF
jgi:hypothetical protein